MSEHDWTRFTKRITIDAPIDAVYRAWATRDGIESWFLRLSEISNAAGHVRPASEFAAAGDRYRWLWHGWPDEVEERGAIIEANGADRFAFTFHDPMTVLVTIRPEHGITVCELTQENIPEDDFARANYFFGCSEGWTFYLANLKSILEGGIDLRNKNPEIKKVINS